MTKRVTTALQASERQLLDQYKLQIDALAQEVAVRSHHSRWKALGQLD